MQTWTYSIAGATRAVASIVGDAVAGAHNFAQFFDIEVEEFTRDLALVAHDRRSRLERAEPSQAVATEEARDGGFGAGALARDLKAWEA